MIRSLRTKLLIGTTAVTATALFILGAAIDTTVRRALLSEFDAALTAKATSVASMVEQHGGRVQFEFQSSMMPEFAAAKDPEYFEVWLGDRPFVRSSSLGTADLPRDPPTASGRIGWTNLPDGRKGRSVTLAFSPYIDPDEPTAANDPTVRATIVTARDTAALDHLLSRLRWAAVGLSTATVALSGASLLLLIHFATRPVRKLAHRIEALDECDLSVRLDSTALPSEIAPVVDRLNGLLSRLSDAFTRERSFTADVAHELRTPLSGILATLEVCRTRQRDLGEYEAAIDKALTQLAHLQTLVEDLLLLARADAGQVQITVVTVDAVPLLEECWLQFVQCAKRENLHVSKHLPDRCAVLCDPQILRIVMTNLFDNAVSYADTGGNVGIGIFESNGNPIIEISNSGSQLKPQDTPRVFERFWRGDSSRTHTGRHAGLGLSLSQRLLSIMGDRISIESTRDGTFIARVNLHASGGNGDTRGTGPQPVQESSPARASSVVSTPRVVCGRHTDLSPERPRE